jgi:hypothetical protein
MVRFWQADSCCIAVHRTFKEPKIVATHFHTISEQGKQELSKKLDWIFSFSQDLTSLYNVMDKDPLLKDLKQKFYG